MTNANDREQVRERTAELGRASGRARRKRGKRSVLDALKAAVSGDPDAFVGQLLSSPAGAVKAAAVLERTGLFGGEEGDAPEPRGPEVPAGVSLGDLVAFTYSTGQAGLFGLPTTVAEFEELLATADEGSSTLGSRARDSVAITERAAASTDDDGGVDEDGGGGSAEIDGTPVPSGNEESVRPSWAPPPDIYADAATQAVHRQRLKRGQSTGHPYDVYRDAGDRL